MLLLTLSVFQFNQFSPICLFHFFFSLTLTSVYRFVSGMICFSLSSSFGDSLPFLSLICIVSLPVSLHLYIIWLDSSSNSLLLVMMSASLVLYSPGLRCCPFPHCSAAILKHEWEMIQHWWKQNGCWGLADGSDHYRLWTMLAFHSMWRTLRKLSQYCPGFNPFENNIDLFEDFIHM